MWCGGEDGLRRHLAPPDLSQTQPRRPRRRYLDIGADAPSADARSDRRPTRGDDTRSEEGAGLAVDELQQDALAMDGRRTALAVGEVRATLVWVARRVQKVLRVAKLEPLLHKAEAARPESVEREGLCATAPVAARQASPTLLLPPALLEERLLDALIIS